MEEIKKGQGQHSKVPMYSGVAGEFAVMAELPYGVITLPGQSSILAMTFS